VIERSEIERWLRGVGKLPDAEVDLGKTALSLAALDRPGTAAERYRRHLAGLADDVAHAAVGASSLGDRIAALNQVFFADYGYRGDRRTYDDPQNANLMRVIDRRKGLPVALGVLYLLTARAQGWEMAGLSFPFHFLLRLEHGGENAILDPFEQGVTVEARGLRRMLKRFIGEGAELDPAHYRPVSDRAVLLRLQSNIKSRALRNQDLARAAEVLRRMVAFAPQHATSWRELGYVEAELGNERDAIVALERFQGLPVGGDERHETAVMLQRLKARQHARGTP
jgi:regulator of sirC expression with transglutaminase-like and TPR domain